MAMIGMSLNLRGSILKGAWAREGKSASFTERIIFLPSVLLAEYSKVHYCAIPLFKSVLRIS